MIIWVKGILQEMLKLSPAPPLINNFWCGSSKDSVNTILVFLKCPQGVRKLKNVKMLSFFYILFLNELDLLQGYINISVDESFKLLVVDLEDSPNWNDTINEAKVSSF